MTEAEKILTDCLSLSPGEFMEVRVSKELLASTRAKFYRARMKMEKSIPEAATLNIRSKNGNLLIIEKLEQIPLVAVVKRKENL